MTVGREGRTSGTQKLGQVSYNPSLFSFRQRRILAETQQEELLAIFLFSKASRW